MLNKAKIRLLKIQSFLSKIDYSIPVLLVLPWLLLLINQSWIFTPASIDPWIYWGYFNNFDSFISAFAGTYYGTRLPWILPGYVCYKIFPPLIANYVLHFSFYYIAIFSLFFTIKLIFGKRAALTSAILLGCYPFFLGAIGWDYVDGAGIAYFLLTLLLLTVAIKTSFRSKWPFLVQRNKQTVASLVWPGILLFFAGGSLAMCIYTNTFLITYVPILILYYIIIKRDDYKYFLVISLFFALAGFATFTVILCGINQAAGGPFFFFLPSFNASLTMVRQTNIWKLAGISWVTHAPWLILLSIAFISSLLHLLYNLLKRKTLVKSSSYNKHNSIFSLSYILMFFFMVLWAAKGQPVFELPYYASYLIPLMFLSVGSQIAPFLAKLRKWQFFALVCALNILMLLSFFSPFHSLFASRIAILYGIIIAIVGIGLMFWLRTKFVFLISVSLLFLFFGILNVNLIGSHWQVDFNNRQQPKQLLLAVAQSDAILQKIDPSVQFRFWYSKDEPQSGAFMAVTSTRLWGYRLINDQFPSLVDYEIRPNSSEPTVIPRHTIIAILSGDEEAFQKATTSLGQIGLDTRLIGEERIEQGKNKFTLTFIEVK